MRRGLIALTAIATSLAAAVPAFAGVTIRGLDTSRLPLVRVTVTVDGAGKSPTPPVIAVAENGRAVGTIAVTAPTANAALALVIDTSGSMHGAPLQAALLAASGFLETVKESDQLAIVGFGHAVNTATTLTADKAALANGLKSLASTDHVAGTALNDGLIAAIQELANSPATSHRVVVVLTDGGDSSSLAAAQDVVAAATKASTAIYSIGLKSRNYDPTALQQLSTATGGSFREAEQGSLDEVYQAVAAELKSTFVLSYTSAEADHIDLAVTADGATARTGYVAGSAPVTLTSRGLVPEAVTRAAWSGYAIAGVAFALMLVGMMFVFRPRPKRTISGLLDSYTEFSKRKVDETGGEVHHTSIMVWLARSTEKVLGNVRYWKQAAKLIERADLPLRTGELFYLQVACALAFGVPAGYAGLFPLITLLLFVIGFFIPLLVVRFKARKRQKLFDDQLPDTLVAMAASLKAGHSWNQAMETIIKEGAEPTAKEFARASSETRLGRASDDALEGMAKRIDSVDFEFVVMSVNIQRQVGGSLADLLDQVGETVRHRQQFRRKVKALTAMGRMSAYTLVGLPFGMGLAITAINANYMAPLFTTSTGHILILIGFGMITIGALMLRKIVSFKV